MAVDDRPDPGTDANPYRGDSMFAARLTHLKETGCTILLTGAVGPETMAAASRSWFGQNRPETAPRKRVLALTDQSGASAASHLPDDSVDDAHHWICNLSSQYRSAPLTADQLPEVGRAPNQLAALQTELQHAIDYYAREHSLSPGELRVGVNSLSYLFEEAEDDRIKQFITRIRDEMQATSGMAHFVARQNGTGRHEDLLNSFVKDGPIDVVCRIRNQQDAQPEEQVYIPGVGTTRWETLADT